MTDYRANRLAVLDASDQKPHHYIASAQPNVCGECGRDAQHIAHDLDLVGGARDD